MPGRHPQGAWIRDRAKRIQESTKDEYGAEKGKRVAYAVATQQAEAKGKAPKGYGTPEGRRTARKKHPMPESMQEKAASVTWEAWADEFAKLASAGGVARTLFQSFLRPIGKPAALWGSKATKSLGAAKTRAEALAKAAPAADAAQPLTEAASKARAAAERASARVSLLKKHRLASLAGPATYLGGAGFLAGKLTGGGGGDSGSTNYYNSGMA